MFKTRLKALLLIKKDKCSYSKDLVFKLGVSRKTIYNWLQTYKAEGFLKLVEVKSGGNNTKVLSQETISEIDRLLNDPYRTIVSYV